LRIGGNSIWTEWFNGLIDEVRVYNRALTAAQIQTDMNTSVTPDTTPPRVLSTTPADGSAGISAGTSPTVSFSEPMKAATITGSTFVLKDASGASVPASVSYDTSAYVATLVPQGALQYGVRYTATVKGGSGGITDVAGNALTADVSWSFTTEASPPQMLVVTTGSNPYSSYLTEILRNEGLNEFTTIDAGFLSSSLLSNFDIVLLGQTTLTASQVSTLTTWVNGGGKLIAMRPDKQLAGLLGLTDSGSTLGDAYLKVDTGSGPGVGIVGQTIQFHGTADRYALNGATAVATLYTNATTATTSPAVTLRSVGVSGGQTAAFTYDLARSVVLTRQGNPAWVGQDRDGSAGIAPDDLFYGAKAGNVLPDWVDTSKIAIPQADEQQRLLVNLITSMEQSKMPLPHFWYLPRGEKAAIALTSDDHSVSEAPGGTAFRFDRLKALSPAGCSVASWQCLRATAFIYPDDAMTNSQAAGYIADGFDLGLHGNFGSCPTGVQTQAQIQAAVASQTTSLRAKYTSIPAPVSTRNHCYFWPDWASVAKVERANGVRIDADYDHYPGSWIGTKPGFMTGGGFPMRFADTDGSLIDVYQENTALTDDATTAAQTAAFINTLLDNAVGALGYYGAFGVLIHADSPTDNSALEDVVAAAQARGVPVISDKQLLTWTDGRNASTIRALNWSAGTFTFTTTVGAGANGLQTVLPTQGPTGTLSALSCNGSQTAYTVQTIKGIQYAMFDAVTGSCQATYS
jgi:hypothetical protein